MKYLITGAGGFVGKRLAQRFAQAGHDVYALMRSAPDPADRTFFDSPRARVVVADITRSDFRDLPDGFDAIVSLAQSSRFRQFPEGAEDLFEVNIAAFFRLLEWARRGGVKKFVHASSGGIYGISQKSSFQETDLLAVDSPLGFYLGTKLCSEVMFQNYRHFFETAVILRPFFIYGHGQRKDMLVPRLVESVKEGRPIQLQGQVGLRLNPVFIDDTVSAFDRALQLSGCHVINLAGPDVLTLREIGERIGALLGKTPVFEVKPGTPLDYVATTDAAISKLGLTLTGFGDGIRRMIAADSP